MNKDNNPSAAGLRRSAVAERNRIRQEWSALKGIDSQNNLQPQKLAKVVKRKLYFSHNHKRTNQSESHKKLKEKFTANFVQDGSPSDVLRGIVVMVDVGAETRALPLRAALTALGANVVPKWSRLVTHLVWSQGGSRAIRAKARALATSLVSPLWVEACAASNKRMPESSFPAASRPSDLPSPRTLKQMLKKAEMENVSLNLSDSEDEDENQMLKLRISTDTSATANTSGDTSLNKSNGTATNITKRDLLKAIENNIRPEKTKRKLWTQTERDLTQMSSDEAEEEENRNPRNQKITQEDRRLLAHTERLTRRLLKSCNATRDASKVFKIVLTGMNPHERLTVANAIRSLNCLIQTAVNKETTHVLLGSCREEHEDNDVQATPFSPPTPSIKVRDTRNARTVNALCGAARGCHVLTSQWALDSAENNRWLHHHCYVVPHLKKIAQKARIERIAFGYQHKNYAYNIFQGMRVYISPNAELRDGAAKLLKLCGATVQNGREIQNGGTQTADFDVKIGVESGTVGSKWVFDSVASARMRNTKRYVNQ